MEQSRYAYSQLSCSAVRDLATENYELGKVDACKFHARGLHDNYLLTAGSKKYILRIYRNSWRSADEIGFELDALSHLGKMGAPVAFPEPTRAGETSCRIAAAEGTRAVALFHYARGEAPGSRITAEQAVLLGRAIADIHRLSAGFNTPYSRPPLELPHLVDDALAACEPFADGDTRGYLRHVQEKLHDRSPFLAKTGDSYGICTGDVNLSNFHIHGNEITVFDFDQCGYGYRAFEIGKFNSSIHQLDNREEIATAFCDGYQQVRQLSAEEKAAIPYFEMVAMIWVLGINANNAELIGYKWLEQPFWNRKTAALRELERKLWPDAGA